MCATLDAQNGVRTPEKSRHVTEQSRQVKARDAQRSQSLRS